MKNQIYVVDTNDSRMFYVMRSLSEQNYNACSLNSYYGSGSPIYCYSPAKRFTNDELVALSNNSDLVCGALSLQNIALLESKDIKHHNILLDEIYAIENAIQTAEAALMMIIRATDLSIFDQRFAIYGYGRLGRALAKIFSGLGLNYVICTNNYYERASAHICCKEVYDLSAPISDVDVIVNTVPAKIFPLEKLQSAGNCKYILDLASFSAVESSDIASLGLIYDNALGLPGKYSPKSAGKVLAKAIINLKIGNQ